MGPDYINRQEAIRDILDFATLIRDRSKMDADTVLGILNNLPPANVAPVVFCKDCAFSKIRSGQMRCFRIRSHSVQTSRNRFCSDGKGRGDSG